VIEGHEQERDRRPTEARRLNILVRAASAFARRGLSPNAISAFGMVCGVLVGLCFAATRFEQAPASLAWLLGVLFLGLRIAANLLDGMVAIESGKPNPTGPLWNEAPDRVADAAMLIGLGCATGGDVVLGLVAAWIATMVAYVRVQARAVGAGSDYGGPMAKPHRAALVAMAAVYMGLAPHGWHPAVGVPTLALGLIAVGGAVTCVRRLRRSARQLRGAAS
jgi:phosphatidylglycerophosphate synthase